MITGQIKLSYLTRHCYLLWKLADFQFRAYFAAR